MNETAKPATVATNTNGMNEKDECPKATRAKAVQALATLLIRNTQLLKVPYDALIWIDFNFRWKIENKLKK